MSAESRFCPAARLDNKHSKRMTFSFFILFQGHQKIVNALECTFDDFSSGERDSHSDGLGSNGRRSGAGAKAATAAWDQPVLLHRARITELGREPFQIPCYRMALGACSVEIRFARFGFADNNRGRTIARGVIAAHTEAVNKSRNV